MEARHYSVSDLSHILNHDSPASAPAGSDMYRGLSAGGDSGGAGPALEAAMPGYFMASYFPMEVGGATADAPVNRALAASRNHREAERRRRERIKSHLDRLRTLLACDPKMDKASLLAKAVEHVRDLKQQAAEIAGAQLIPTEADEVVVVPTGEHSSSSGGHSAVFNASLCCEDRSDLLSELVETLRSLRLRTLRAEIATLGGRVRNVLVLARETQELEGDGGDAGGRFLRDALAALVDRLVPVDRSKRRRVLDRAPA